MHEECQQPGVVLEPGPRSAGKVQSQRVRAYRYIQSKIVSGGLPAGEPISELSLSREIGISRTPVREAIGRLTAEGFLEQTPGRGTLVKLLTRAEIQELYELREALEVYAVGKAARQPLHESDLKKLSELCEAVAALADSVEASGQPGLDRAGMEHFLAVDLHFHLLLLRAAGNHRILKVVRDTRLMIRIFNRIKRPIHDCRLLRDIYGFHKGILEALRTADADRAMQLCGEHIRRSCREVSENYDRWERASGIQLDDEMLAGFGGRF